MPVVFGLPTVRGFRDDSISATKDTEAPKLDVEHLIGLAARFEKGVLESQRTCFFTQPTIFPVGAMSKIPM